MSNVNLTKNKILTQGALLIALTVILQGLRLLIPLPLPVSTFLIGSLVHMMLTLTVRLNCLATAILLSCVLPLFAYVQGQLLLPFLIPVVVMGNVLFVVLVQSHAQGWQLILPPLLKAIVMGAAAYLALLFLGLEHAKLYQPILLAMTLPQFSTGIIGILLAKRLEAKIRLRKEAKTSSKEN